MHHVAYRVCVCGLQQWLIDSAATVSWNVGKSPDSRALICLEKHGLSTNHKARQVVLIILVCCDYCVTHCVNLEVLRPV